MADPTPYVRRTPREVVEYLADPHNWLGNPYSHDAVLFGHDTPYELARSCTPVCRGCGSLISLDSAEPWAVAGEPVHPNPRCRASARGRLRAAKLDPDKLEAWPEGVT